MKSNGEYRTKYLAIISAFSSLIKSQALSDLNRIYEIAKKHGIDFNWVAVPIEYEPLDREKFDMGEMKRLYNLGYEIGLKENVLRKGPTSFRCSAYKIALRRLASHAAQIFRSIGHLVYLFPTWKIVHRMIPMLWKPNRSWQGYRNEQGLLSSSRTKLKVYDESLIKIS